MNTAILITARLKSTRLPRKVLKPILGRPMIAYLVDRLRRSEQSEGIILCTSPVAQDDPLAEWALNAGLHVFRGDPEDVLLRLTSAAEHYGVRTVVSCTADNPFVDSEYIDRLVEFHLAGGYDYTRSEGLPFGTFAYALRVEAMREACNLKASSETEVWGGYFTQAGVFACGVLQVTDPEVHWPDLRLTVDTPEDFRLAEAIIRELSPGGAPYGLREIVALCRRRPDLAALNKDVVQKQAPPAILRRGHGAE